MRNKVVILILVFFSIASVIGCKKGIKATCADKIENLKLEKTDIGVSFMVECPADCTTGSIWGTDTYTMDSAVCLAAVHAGIVPADKGGIATITITKSLPSYKGSERNGVKSNDWSSSWGDKAFTVSK